MVEIIKQEKAMNLKFDVVAIAVGSGGTYSGLLLGKMLTGSKVKLPGYLVGGSIGYFEEAIYKIFEEFSEYFNRKVIPEIEDIQLTDKYIGRGYGLNNPEEIEFIKYIARLEGVIFDNVYTGKALYGLVTDIKKGMYRDCKNILFIHTGGMFELFSQTNVFK
jgi:D-cysteine desulfhydrase